MWCLVFFYVGWEKIQLLNKIMIGKFKNKLKSCLFLWKY